MRSGTCVLRKLIPEVSFHDLVRAGAGVRAQAVAPDGKLVDDFFIRQAERMIHVLNAVACRNCFHQR